MNRIEASRRIDRPPEPVYETLAAVTQYPAYSEYLDAVDRVTGADDRYRLAFAWWQLSYTIRTQVVERDPPRRLDWKTDSALTARGAWIVEELPNSVSAVTLSIEYDPDSVEEATVSLPFGVSMGWVAEKVSSLAAAEAEHVLDRIAEDLESVSDPAR